MREPLSFFAYGTPKGQPRAKACRRGNHAGVYDPGTADEWKSWVRTAAIQAWDGVKWEGPLKVSITIYFPRPKNHYGSGKNERILKPKAPVWHSSKPDRDNCDKAIMDALGDLYPPKKIGIWNDDAQVCDGRIKKLYANGDQATGALITIQEAWE